MATEQFAGPVDYIVFALPVGADPGPGLRALLQRVEQSIVEVLDLEIIARDDAGAPVKLTLADLQASTSLNLSVLDGAESGILDAEDLAEIASVLEDGQLAIALVYEDRSLAEAAAAWTRVGGTELFSGGIDLSDLEHALDQGDLA